MNLQDDWFPVGFGFFLGVVLVVVVGTILFGA